MFESPNDFCNLKLNLITPYNPFWSNRGDLLTTEEHEIELVVPGVLVNVGQQHKLATFDSVQIP